VGVGMGTLALYVVSEHLLATVFPNAPSQPPTINGIFIWILLWGSMFSALRPLLPNDAPKISN
jgi:hypothetical protein